MKHMRVNFYRYVRAIAFLIFGFSPLFLSSQCMVGPVPAGPAVCPVDLVQYGGFIPNGSGLYAQNWKANAIPDDDLGNVFTGASDALGLQTHPNPADNVEAVYPFSGLGDPFDFGTIVFDGAKEQGQSDGFLVVPICLGNSVSFQISGGGHHGGAFYAGSGDGCTGMVKVVENSILGNEGPTTALYTIPVSAPTITPRTGCSFRLLRIRFYHTDRNIAGKTEVAWDLEGNGSFTDIPVDYFYPAQSPDDCTQPTIQLKSRNCDFAYKDANGDLYTVQPNKSVGAGIALNSLFCEGVIGTIQESVVANNTCPAVFTCGAAPVKIEFSEPAGSGDVFLQDWFGAGIAFNNAGNVQTVFTDAFSNTVGGLPAHPNMPSSSGIVASDGLGISSPDRGGAEQFQVDAWVAVPPGLECVGFRIGAGARAQASALFVGIDFMNMNDSDSELNGTDTDIYTFTSGASTFGCGWQWLRVRFYVFDDFAFYNGKVQWDVGAGFANVPSKYVEPADDPIDNTPPTGVMQQVVSTTYGLIDGLGNLFATPGNCDKAPTMVIDITGNPLLCANVTGLDDVADCSGDAACVASFNCDPCRIEIDEVGCICDNPENTFTGPKPNSVSIYKQFAYISSPLGNNFTIENAVGITIVNGPSVGQNPNVAIFEYTVTPGVPYSYEVVIDGSDGIREIMAGECSDPDDGINDDCECPIKPEICGDNLDNDCDGLVDADDPDVGGNCIMDCESTPIEIQGRMAITDAHVTAQIWSRRVGGAFCCTAPAGRQESPVGPGSGNNRLVPFQTADGMLAGPNYNTGNLPKHIGGASGITTTILNTLGVQEAALRHLFTPGRGDQAQIDAWIVLPPTITCFELKINNPRAHDASSLFLGNSIQAMEFIGSSYGIAGRYKNATTVDGSSIQMSGIFNYDATAHPTFGCGWRAVRARVYTSDVSAFQKSPVQWNIGNGFENIPAKFLQTVGTTASDADTDNLRPSQEMLLAPFCGYLDSDGDLFTQNGKFYALNTLVCEEVVNSQCLNCPPRLTACVEDCVEVILDNSSNPTDTFPECFMEVYNLTQKKINQAGTLLTSFWDANDGAGFNRSILNDPITVAFSKFSDSPGCPNCYPQHDSIPTGMYQSSTLGVADAVSGANDSDGDVFNPALPNLRGGDNAQQDGWLLIPGGISCIDFKLGGGGAYDASRLYLGSGVDNMQLVGSNVNRRGQNDFDTFSFDIPADAPIVDPNCVEPVKALRLRFYHHDNAVRSNTTVQWNVGRGFVVVPATHLRTVGNECDNTLPSNPTYSETVIKVVRDKNAKIFLYSSFPANQPLDCDYIKNGIEVDRADKGDCYKLDPVCNSQDIASDDPKGVCQACMKPYPQISDPCYCLDNGGIGVGQYSETVKVTGPSNKVWYIKSVNGLTQPPAGVFPPARGAGLYPIISFPTGPTGTKLTEMKLAGNISMYLLQGIHIDNVGFTITVSDGTTELSIGNKCTECIDPDMPGSGSGSGSGSGDDSSSSGGSSSSSCGLIHTDDGLSDGNYSDAKGRKIYTFCPDNAAKEMIRLNFFKFDLSPGDTFRVYTGNSIFSNNFIEIIGTGGVGNMQITKTGVGFNLPLGAGGWVASPCNNPSGCLTILWSPNGDNNKGSGWELKTECIDRSPELGECTIENYKVACLIGKLKIGKIKTPKVTLKNTCSVKDSTYFLEYDIDGKNIKRDTILADSLCLDSVILGTHALNIRVKYVGADGLKGTADDSTCIERICIFSVQSRTSLVCNDSLILSLGAACSAKITPDDVLENPDLSGNAYKIEISDVVTGKSVTNNVENNNTANVEIQKAGVYNYKITDACGQSCSGKINVKDASAPSFIGTTRDTIVNCKIDLTEKGLGVKKPTAIDNCTEAMVSFVGASYIRDGLVCDTSIVEVIWQAEDAVGNISILKQTIVIIRPDLSKFVGSPDITLSCGQDSPDVINDLKRTGIPGMQIGRIKNGVFEVTDTIDLSVKEYICGYILKKEDVKVPGAGCGNKVYRYWDLLDWCEKNGLMPKDTQAILFKDKLAPKFEEETSLEATEIELDDLSCTYDLTKITNPKATDLCDENPLVRLDRVFRIEDGSLWAVADTLISHLDCDSFVIRWVAEDHCHEQLKNDTLLEYVNILDKTLPSAVTIDRLNISLSHEDGITIHANDIDGGSYDACGIAKKEIRIKDSGAAWDTIVKIGCEYIHPDVQLELRITDLKGNINIAWMDLTVEDKIIPICNLLDNVTKYCDDYHTEELGTNTDTNNDNTMDDGEYLPLTGSLLALYDKDFGNPICDDNLKPSKCGDFVMEQEYQLIEKSCGEVSIKRRYRVSDWSENKSKWVVQSISLVYKANWKITLPADWEGNCGDTAPPANITIENGNCDLLAHEVTEKKFDVPGEACYKIERTYHIINWCKYQAGGEPTRIARIENSQKIANSQMVASDGANAEIGYFTYIQVLKVYDNEAPIVTVFDPQPCINGIDFDAIPYGEEDQSPNSAPYECDELKTWTASAVDCSSQGVITWIGKLFDANGNVVYEVSTNTLSYIVSNKETYTVEFWAYDGCGNSGGEKGETLKFWDCKNPTPYLLHGVAIELGQQGEVAIWATDLDKASFDNCTDQSNLKLKIWHTSLGAVPTDLSGVEALPEVITLTCDYVGNQALNIYVIDEEGNYDYAETYVLVQDNMSVCTGTEPSDNMIGGKIVSANSENITGVKVSVNGMVEKDMTTTDNGIYQFELSINGDYTVTPEKNEEPLNGVSTFDLVLISKHILGISKFDTPYKFIAADINKSGTITTFDMVQLRQLILNITTKFPQNDSWRFVTTDYEFTTESPESENFREFVNINNLKESIPNIDFVGVKIGDINGNARVNSLVKATSRATNTFNFHLADRNVSVGEIITIPFVSTDVESILGYQFTLRYSGLEFVKIGEGINKVDNFNVNIAERGFLTASWNGTAIAEDELFSLTFKASTNGLLSELIELNSDLTSAEAYSQSGELLDIDLEFSNYGIGSYFELFQNSPNPFNGKTVIGFNLPKASSATIKVMDVQGRLLKEVKGDFFKGYNEVSLNAKEIGSVGVLYYQLESANNLAVKKMIILE